MSALSAPRILNEPVFWRFSSFRYTSRPASPDSASDFSVGVRRMCGPMAAAAVATADASSAFAVNTEMLPSEANAGVSVRGRSFAVDEIGVLEELDVPRRLPHTRQQNRRVAELLLRVRMDVQHVVPERKALFRRRAGLEIVDLRELLVVQRCEPGAHLPLVALPVVDERLRRRVVA